MVAPLLIALLFSHHTYSKTPIVKDSTSTKDSITIAVEPQYDDVSGLHRVLFGENYRKLWAVPVKLRIMNLATEKGGLTILQKGGGLQTKSLRLRDKDGNEWVLRSVQKYPERKLPPKLKESIAKAILQDQVTTANPFASLTVPPLAEALGVPHSNPQIIYIGDDPVLGSNSKDFKNTVCLFEEREPLESENTDNTAKVQKKLRDDNDVMVDQKIVLRARLLDMIIGDWDRHEDQWRWDKDKKKKSTVYTPIPRDRDQVYYKTSGLFPWIIAHQYLKTRFQPYDDKIRDIDSWNFIARNFDRYFLNDLSEADWKEQISYVQSHLTDEVITQAVNKMPAKIVAISGKQIIHTIKARRTSIGPEALSYYRFISKMVDVPTSDKREKIQIDEAENGQVSVTIQKVAKDSVAKNTIYSRVFDPKVTKEVRIYGMDGNDAFSVTGNTPSPIKVRMIGGADVDSFYVDSTLNNKRNLYIYDHKDEHNVLPSRSAAKIRTANDTSVNSFNGINFKYDNNSPIVLANYNTDQGLTVIAGFLFEKQGFRQDPYRYHQTIIGGYTLSRESFMFSYLGDFKKAIGNNDLSINILSRGPNNVSNFFGIGNETAFNQSHAYGIKYYRNHFNVINADGRLYHNYTDWQISGGVTGQVYYSSASENSNHLLDVYAHQNTGEDVYQAKAYAGVVAGLRYDTRNNTASPTEGLYWNTTVNETTGLIKSSNTYTQLSTEFNFYLNPDRDSIFTIANRVGGGTILGHADFFQQMKLGGPQNLRGFHTDRFTGRTMVYDNLELRLKLFNFNSYLFPGTVGAIGFNDVGRVWVPGESSNKWHNGFGGGLYIIPADLIMIQATVGHSGEGNILYLNLGYRF